MTPPKCAAPSAPSSASANKAATPASSSWLDNLRADVTFGWRQLMKRKVTTAAAVLSLALAIGACISAFRLIDALFLRPLPVAHPDRLNFLAIRVPDGNGVPRTFDEFAYPEFARMRAAAQGQAELIAASFTSRTDLTYATDNEMEKGYVQYVSGWMFPTFELQPVVGRLFTADDERTPGASPYAVISYNYWTRRFANDPSVLGRSVHIGSKIFQIIGVGPKSFTGTEPGTITDIFLPTMMNPDVTRDDTRWLRTLVIVNPGVPIEPLRAKLDAVSLHFETERAKGFVGMSQHNIEMFLQMKILIEPAASGVSRLQDDYRRALVWLGVLVALVLLIGCVNVSNLMTAQAASRAREMALRVSIGAGRARLVQLVLVENALLALFSARARGNIRLVGRAFCRPATSEPARQSRAPHHSPPTGAISSPRLAPHSRRPHAALRARTPPCACVLPPFNLSPLSKAARSRTPNAEPCMR